MSNKEDESTDKNLPGYQFFSADLNYNYFDQSNAAVGASPTAPTSSTDWTTPTVSTSPTDSTPSLVSTSPPVWATPTALASPTTETKPEAVPYSISAIEPEPTFEERVAAMEREIAEADAASARARLLAAQVPAASVGHVPALLGQAPAPLGQAPASSLAQLSAPLFAQSPDLLLNQAPDPLLNQAPAQAFALTSNLQTPGLAPAVEETSLLYTGTANAAAPREEKWNKYPEANCDSTRLSADFNFNRSLLKIFWRIDVDHNNRVSKNELAIALDNNWFDGDERLLAMLLYESYEDISPEAIFCDAGLSVNNILNFAPFAPMVAEKLESQNPGSTQSDRNNSPARSGNKKSTKSSQSLRSMFRR